MRVRSVPLTSVCGGIARPRALPAMFDSYEYIEIHTIRIRTNNHQ